MEKDKIKLFEEANSIISTGKNNVLGLLEKNSEKVKVVGGRKYLRIKKHDK